ncbi:Dnmt3b [Symbiodinium sp. CCMP2592]|nr:Dnmt3b [Symbiodinium sp. CCMP2592]
MADELWDTLRLRGLAAFAPHFVQCRVVAVDAVPLHAAALIAAGIPAWAVELAARGREPTASMQPPAEERRRDDFPRPPRVTRASMQAAFEAARPENRRQALASLDQDVLAASTVDSNNSRIRFYTAICRAWGIEPWPLSRESVRAFGACLKAGGYKSVAVYFSAVIGHQVRTMWQAPSPELRRCMQDTRRAVLRGAGPTRLKDFFDVPILKRILDEEDERAFSIDEPSHMGDVMLACAWWMLREIESSSAQVCHVRFNDRTGEVTLMLPVQKCDQRGTLCCRTLLCACRAAQQVLCPFHCLKRHMTRLSRLGSEAVAPRAPLFPSSAGGVLSKDQFIKASRTALQACGLETTREFEGVQLERFTGHIARISGVQWLHNIGIPMAMLQVLGRWASLTILRYLQSAPLQTLPATAARALNQGSAPPSGEGGWLLIPGASDAPLTEAIAQEGSDDEVQIIEPGRHKRRRRQAVQPQAEAEAESRPPSPADGADQATLEGLRNEMATVQAALSELKKQESYIVQGRSRKHHRIAIPEAANPPTSWSTVCGWKYGLSKFYRSHTIGSSDQTCCRCFNIVRDDGHEESSQGSETGSENSSGESSDSSSSSDLDTFDGDYGKLGRQIQDSFERAVAFHKWNVGSVVRDYLAARGVLSVGTLSMLARDDEDFRTTIIEPLIRGFDTGHGVLELDEVEKPIARAVLLYMFHLAREARAAAATTSTPTPTGPSVTSSLGTVSAKATNEDRAPKTLPPKVWSDAVAKYNSVCIAGVPREFPVQKLVGAESVLSRFHWEHVTSKAYSPLELGELVSKRSFTATGGVNYLAARKKPTKLEFDGESLQTTEEATWEPRSLWSVVDGLDAIRWCHILFEVGEEHQINRFYDEMIRRARQHPDKVEIFRDYYAAVSWSICMAMRVNKTYKEASDAILTDVTMWNEYMAREPKDNKKRKKPDTPSPTEDADWAYRAWTPKGYGGKGKGKGKKGGKQREWQGQSWRQWQPTPSWGKGSWSRPSRWTRDDAKADEPSQPAALGESAPETDTQVEPTAPHQAIDSGDSGKASSTPSTSQTGFPPGPAASENTRAAAATVTLRGDSALPVGGLDQCGDVILLSFFDGVGSAALALRSLGVRVRATIEWENDPSALTVSAQSCKCLRLKRGDLTADDPQKIAIILQDFLREKKSTVLVTAGPPCPDYSKLNASAQGRAGDSGQLFVRFAEFLRQLESIMQMRFQLLVENVLMQKATDLEWFNRALDARPIAADAASFGLISRPRTWWTRIDWTRVNRNPYYPDKALKWDRLDGLDRLQLGVQPDDPASFQMKGLQFHETILNNKRKLPCLTTPAPGDEGRPPPKKMRGTVSAAAKQRWLSGNRQYAPWVYEDHALVYEASGDGQLLPAELKEQLHHYPEGFTRHQRVPPKERHRLLGNSWHVGVARFLLALVLLNSTVGQSKVQAHGIEDAMTQAKARDIPVAGHIQGSSTVPVRPAQDMWEQWENSASINHPLLDPPELEVAVQRTMHAIMAEGSALPAKRAHILEQLRDLRSKMQTETKQWFDSLPPHVASAYTYDNDKIVQIPLLMRLLRGCGYPDCDRLEKELCSGFPLIGQLSRSPGWHPRTDDWYDHPIPESVFAKLNRQHVRERAARPRPDPEWQTMLSEVLQERDKGLLEGPFEAHPDWGFQAVGPSTSDKADLLPMTSEVAYAAFAFSVVQEGSDNRRKVRRCEDYRRSHHNDTVRAFDKPPHDTVDTYVRIVRAWASLHQDAQVWCQDMMSAYRQYPVQEPTHAYMLLQLPHGVSVWRHRVLPFGSAPSVWHFNRCTDAVVWLSRCLVLVLALHYVDDVGGPEPSWSASSACATFRELCEILGIRVKPSKEQLPATVQKVLGVLITIQHDMLQVKPDPERIRRVSEALRLCLKADRLTPEEASRLCGKLVFLQSSLFGMVGRAALSPLYSRSHGGARQDIALNQGLRSAITVLLSVLQRAKPRCIPLRPASRRTSVVYADAFFKLGDRLWKAGHAEVRHWTRSRVSSLQNGWGFLAKAGAVVTAGHGDVPAAVVELFGTRKAYIFFLEVNAQILALLANRRFLDSFWVCFIDNRAGKAALVKGFSGDPSINNLLAFFWCLCCELGWFGHFEWVASKLNPSDPISRGELDGAVERQARFLQRVPQAYWSLLAKIANSMEYATGDAVQEALQIEFCFA